VVLVINGDVGDVAPVMAQCHHSYADAEKNDEVPCSE
jgi:hypothetical protein